MSDQRFRMRVVDVDSLRHYTGAPWDAEAKGVAIVITGFKDHMDTGSVEKKIMNVLRRETSARKNRPELDIAIATAKLEAFEQMARYWESRGCKMEAFEARRMARELGL